MLYVRMFLYLVFGAMAGQGLVIFDADTGDVSFNIEDVMTLAQGLVGFVATFASSRVAKSNGGAT